MKDKDNKKPQENEETHGTGEQYVLEPETDEQHAKVDPHEELPEKVLTEDGKLVNLETGDIKVSPNIINLCGRDIDTDEFGDKGEGFIKELYEEWLGAVQSNLKSTFAKADEDYVNSAHILDHLPPRYAGFKKKVKWYTEKHPVTGEVRTRGYLCWDQRTSFEEWVIFTLATLRWRLDEEIEGRRIMQALRDGDIRLAKHIVEQCIIIIETWLALPESKQLISV